MSNINDMKDLIAELNAASNAYYNSGDTIMSDVEFDTKLEILKNWEKESGVVMSNSPTHRVGAPVLSDLPEVKHNHPMLSLAKCHYAQEVYDWAKGEDLIAMVKCDGLTCSLKYIDGEFVSAETRGDGETGTDVTEHVKHFTNVPMHINKPGTYIVDGEAIIFKNDFDEINKDGKFKNPRNTAAGTLNLLDVSEVEKRRLSFIAWDVIEGSNEDSLYKKLEECKKLGFTIVPFSYTKNCKEFRIDTEYIDSENESIQQSANNGFIPIDGVVWKIDDCEKYNKRGRTDHHFSGGIAFKYRVEEVESTLRDIVYDMGKTGVLTPVGIFDSVEIDGTEVERASLSNISVMKETLGLHPYTGQKIYVTKRNQIIPKIERSEKCYDFTGDSILIPLHCPICDYKTQILKENDSEVLTCTNPNCQGKLLGRLNHFVSKKAMDIDGLSEATLEFLINKGWVRSFTDIYRISNNAGIIVTWQNTPGFGITSVKKICAAIEKSRNTTLDKFLCAISIPNVGSHAAKDIAKYCDGDVWKFGDILSHAGAKEFKKINGIGDKIVESINDWMENSWEEFLSLVEELNIIKPEEKKSSGADLTGKTFVITGSVHIFKNRDAIKERIESLGGKVAGSVSKKTNYLICNEASTSSKAKKAMELGTKVITEEDFVKMIGE